jgi:hypothetical protein
VRRHAKASSAGSKKGSGIGLGSIRAALPTRAASSNANGSGERRHRRAPLGFLGALVLAITVSLGAASALADAPPALTIEAPTAVSYTSAHLSGTVNPEGGPSETLWHFEYSPEPSSFWIPVSGDQSAGSGSSAVNVAEALQNLQPNTTYSVRLVASNETGANSSATEAPYPSFTTVAVPNPTISIVAPTAVSGTGAHFSGEINPGGTDPAFNVNWHFECTPGCPGLQGGAISADTSNHQVSATAAGLQPNTAYEVSLVASNAGGQGSTAPKTFSTEAVRPVATTIPAFALEGGTKALVGGRVNPENSPTKYWVQYGTDERYGHSAPATQDAEAASGGEATVVTQEISKLTPGTTYHFRIVAENPTGTTESEDMTFESAPALATSPPDSCSNAQFRTGPGAGLPDCRAYEQVSPIEKNGADILAYETLARAAANGNRAAFSSYSAFGDAKGLKTLEPYVSKRSPDGWSASALYPPQEVQGTEFFALFPTPQGYSKQLTRAALKLTGPAPVSGAQPGTENLYTRDLDSGAYTLLTPVGVPSEISMSFAAASADFSHILFESSAKLTPEAPIDSPSTGRGNPINLYENVDGEVRLVGILPNGEPAPEGAKAGAELRDFPVNDGFWGGAIEQFYTENTISADGSIVFWGDLSTDQLYARIDGTETVHVSASQRTEPEEPQPAFFRGATPDGSKVFFTSAEKLTDNATARPNGPFNGDLYSYQIETGELTDLTVAASGTADVLGFLGTGGDGSFAYFVAGGAPLAPGAPTESELVNADGTVRSNLYLSHDGQITYIATLGAGSVDTQNWELNSREGISPRLSRVSADGRHLLFSSTERLTSYDNAGHVELYRYGGVSHDLQCVSCNPSGSRASFGAAIAESAPDGNAKFSVITPFLTNVLSDDGGRIFFQTKEALLPSDSNGRTDVYEWEEGQVHLISTGQASTDSFLGDASVNGNDVFFVTRQQLVGQDEDQNGDMYDARVEGGIAAQNPAAPPPPCMGDTCRGPSSASPTFQAPGSAGLIGPGNQQQRKHKRHKRHHKARPSRDHHGGKHRNGKQSTRSRS